MKLANRTWKRTYTTGMVKGKFNAIDLATKEAVLAMEVRTDCISDRWVIMNDQGDYRVTIVHSTPYGYGMNDLTKCPTCGNIIANGLSHEGNTV